jgi:hypothetical protein
MDRVVDPAAIGAIPMHRRRVVEVEAVVALGASASEKGVIVEQPELLFSSQSGFVDDEFPRVVARSLGFPQLLYFGVGVESEVQARVSPGPRWMHGTDYVGVMRVEETAIALLEFGHSSDTQVPVNMI